jgi:hypothetical protein
MLALLNDPVTQKTKWLLLIPIGLAIVLIFLSSSLFQDTNNSNIIGGNGNNTYE